MIPMTVKKMTSGRHKGEYQVRVQPWDKITGKRISLPIRYVLTKKEAKQLEQEMWARCKDKGASYTANMLFPDCFQEYIDGEFEQGRWTKSTFCSWQYSSQLIHEYFTRVKMKDVTSERIRLFARQVAQDRNLDVSPNSVLARCLMHMRAFFKQYVGSIYPQNPVIERALERFFRLDEMSIKHERYVLSSAEIDSLFTTIQQLFDPQNPVRFVSRLAVYIDLLTGMRPQELQAVRWDDLHQDNGTYFFQIYDAWNEHEIHFNGHLKAKKRGEERLTLPFSADKAQLIEAFHHSQTAYLEKHHLKNPNNLILLALDDYKKCALGQPVSQTALNKELRSLGKKIGVRPGKKTWSMYSLRHTVATKLGNNPQMSYPWAAARLGHRLDMFMKTYVHNDADIDKEMQRVWLS